MPEQDGRLADNLVHFARALRAAGIPVGPGAVLDALAAVETAGIGAREDFYWILHAVLVKRHEHSLLFEQAFRIFFRRRGRVRWIGANDLHQGVESRIGFGLAEIFVFDLNRINTRCQFISVNPGQHSR